MMSFERLAVVYFVGLAAASPFSRAPVARALVAIACSAAAGGAVLVVSRTAADDVRAWAPHLYLVAGYWMPALLRGRSPGRLDRWLQRDDARWRAFRLWLDARAAPALELAYLLCYPLIPIAFLTVRALGAPADVERFWLSVLGAGFLCYGTLPWLVSLPPRAIEATDRPPLAIHRLNEAVLDRVSHRLNTFPSAHVAISSAAAFTMLGVWWPAGVAMAIAAVGIALGSVTGRYHYVPDALLGAALGVMSGALSRAA